MVDTKNFTFKTGVRTFEAAAYLRKNNVDILKVKKWFQSDLESYNMIADVVIILMQMMHILHEMLMLHFLYSLYFFYDGLLQQFYLSFLRLKKEQK